MPDTGGKCVTISSFSVYVASSFCAHMVLFGRFKWRSCKAVTRTDSRLSYSESDILSVRHVFQFFFFFLLKN